MHRHRHTHINTHIGLMGGMIVQQFGDLTDGISGKAYA